MEKVYEIKKIKVVLFRPFIMPSDYFGDVGVYVKQFMYVDGNKITDIFGDKYISGLYCDGEIPEFYYNFVNSLGLQHFNLKELNSGVVSEARLLQIYCIYNSDFISYEDALRQDKFSGTGIIDISRFNLSHKISTFGRKRNLKKEENK